MKKLLFACLLLFAFGCDTSKKKGHVIDDTKSPRFLYVLNAKSGTYENKVLKLEGVHSVIYFSDRPNRLAGHMSLDKFTKQWKKEEVKEDPPNATLSILEQKKDQNIVIEVTDPQVEDGAIAFNVKAIKGDIPKKFTSSALFIDQSSPSNPYFAYENFREDFHAIDCSCAKSITQSN